jgi:hypothetical protein
MVVAAPDGDLTNDRIAPVEAIVEDSADWGTRLFTVLCEAEPGDLEALAAGGRVAVTFWGGMVPFAVHVVRPA